MSAALPFWLLIAPIVLVLIDSIVAPKTSAMSRTTPGIASTAAMSRP